MTQRLALWSLVGLIVACGWVVFTMSLEPATLLRLEHGRYFWTVADITAPAALLRHYPLKYYWFVLLNAVAYALVGLAFEPLRRHPLRHMAARQLGIRFSAGLFVYFPPMRNPWDGIVALAIFLFAWAPWELISKGLKEVFKTWRGKMNA